MKPNSKIAELEQELAETTAEQNHRGDKIRELLKENERLREENAVLSRHEVTDETVKRDMITVMEENERLKEQLKNLHDMDTKGYEYGMYVFNLHEENYRLKAALDVLDDEGKAK